MADGAVVATLVARLTSDIKGFSAGMAAANRDLTRVESGMDRAAARAQSVGRSMTRGLTVPLAAGLAGGVVAFANFDQAMTESLAIMGQVDSKMRNQMAEAAREVGRTTTFSASEAAEGYFFLASAGLDAAQSVAAMPQVAQFAQAGMFDLARATDLATDAQSALGMKSSDAQENLENLTRVTDVLVKANALANASVEQFAEAITTKFGASLRTVNKDVEEGAAALAHLADQGLKGSDAGNAMTRWMQQLSTQSLKNRDAFEELNIAVFDSSGKMRHIADIVEDFENSLGPMNDEQKSAALLSLGMGDRLAETTKQLMGGSDAIRDYEKNLRRAGGTTEDVADKQLESFSNQMTLAKDAIVDAGISIGSVLAPAILDIAQAVAGAARWFSNLDPAVQGVAVAMAAAVAAAGPLIWLSGSLITNFRVLRDTVAASRLSFAGLATFLTNPFVLAVGAAVAAMVVYNQNVKNQKAAHDTAIESAEKLAEAMQAQEAPAKAVRDATADLRRDLRGMSDEAAQAKLFRIGYELVNEQGKTPEEAFAVLEQVAENTFGRDWVLDFDAAALTDFKNELEAIQVTAERVGREIEANWTKRLLPGHLGAEAEETMSDLAKQAQRAFDTGNMADAVAMLNQFEEGLRASNASSQTVADSMNHITDEFLKAFGPGFGFETSSSADLIDALGEIGKETSAATQEQRDFANAMVIGLDAGRDFTLVLEDMEEAQRLSAATGTHLVTVMSLMQRAAQGDAQAQSALQLIMQRAAGSAGELEAAVEGGTEAMTAQEQAAEATRVAVANAFSELSQEAGEFQSAVANAMAASTSLVQEFGSDAEVALSDLRTYMEESQQSMRDWADNMRELSRAGLDEGLLRELAEAGPESAALVQALTDMVREEGVSGINGWRAENKSIVEGILTDIGGLAGEAEDEGFKIGYGLGSGVEKGLLDRIGAARRGAERIVSEAVAAARQGGRIESPSKVFAEKVGLPIAQGVALGIRQGQGEVGAALAETMRTATSRGSSEYHYENHITVNNPVGETSEESISNELRRTRDFGGG